ncbi:MAG: hypothetical protein KIT35_00215 [Piscinibacter sp.]|uniref:calcium-binding protein n=1 Tax=Piscinibacter sp. TaxID=1903157 RepID=UPI0025881CD2|nr:calcium-binding protein [Piscinibacter sp.]MCW5662234.1 hypothetical protein [Piscinibacter sp.]
MADFTLTASADSLVGSADVADSFYVNAVGHLAGTDTLAGGAGAGTTDRLVLGSTLTLGAALFANVSGIERLVFNAGGGSSVTLLDAMVASSNAGSFSVSGGAGNDILNGAGVLGTTLRASGAGGDDQFTGGGGADRLAGGSGNDTLVGNAGNDTLSGGAGDDRISAGPGTDRLDGGAGDDLYLFADGTLDLSDLLSDESGSGDTLQFSGAAAVVFSASLANRVSGIERVVFGSGNDVFTPGPGFGDAVEAPFLSVDGGAGDDSLNASALSPLLPLDLLLAGGAGADTLIGGRGNDTLDAGTGLGTMDGGAGNDLLIVRSADLNGNVALSGGANGNDTASDGDTLRLVGAGSVNLGQLANITGIEIVELDPLGNEIVVPDTLAAGVSSTAFDLTLRGSAEDDSFVLAGLAAGRDIVVYAGAGDDTLVSLVGDDTVYAGSGADTLALGAGSDRVLFGAGELSGLDQVTADAGVAGDRLDVALVAGRTLAAGAFAGISGFDTFAFTGGAAGTTAAVRLPANLVTQSGLASVGVVVSGSGNLIVDGRAVGGTWTLTGGTGNDTLFGGSGANTLNGSSGEDTIIGGDGGDTLLLAGGSGDRDLALITAVTDGTVDINGVLSASALAGADRVSGLGLADNYIAVDWQDLGLPNGTTLVVGPGQNIGLLGYGAVRLNTADEIAGNAFGSLTAVRNAVGARLTNGAVGVDERTIFVISGADESEFGVYYFEDRDDNATIDVADVLTLLAIGDTDVPGGLSPGRGFTLTSFDL